MESTLPETSGQKAEEGRRPLPPERRQWSSETVTETTETLGW